MILLILLWIFSVQSGLILLKTSFDNDNTGVYTETQWKIDWKSDYVSTKFSNLDSGRVRIAKGNIGKYIKVNYPKGGVGPSESGALWKVLLSGDHDELYASYKVQFPTNFVRGGKLPGLCAQVCPSGGNVVTGSNGFSARYAFKPDNKVIVYCYHLDQVGKYGDEWPLNYKFEYKDDLWYNIEQRVKMNTGNLKNGEIEVWVDGNQVLLKKDNRFRNVSSVHIDAFYFSSFYGGDDPSYSPSKNETIMFDDFVVSDYKYSGSSEIQTFCEMWKD